MTRRKRTWIGLALAATTMLATFHATPSAAAAQLRAIQCCADHCQHEDPFAASRRCCVINPEANQTAVVSMASQLRAPALSGPGELLTVLAPLAPDTVRFAVRVSMRAGPPPTRLSVLRC